MDKKATSVLVMLFEVIIVLFVIITAFGIARSYASSERVNKINLAEDLSMMINVLVGTPGDALIEHPSNNVSKYTFILTNNSVRVFIQDDSEREKVVRQFFLPERYTAFGTLNQKDDLCLKKEGRKILLHECKT